MIRTILNVYILLLLVDTILSYIPAAKNHEWAKHLRKVCDLSLAPIRKVLPPDLPFDISPIIVILIIKMIEALW